MFQPFNFRNEKSHFWLIKPKAGVCPTLNLNLLSNPVHLSVWEGGERLLQENQTKRRVFAEIGLFKMVVSLRVVLLKPQSKGTNTKQRRTRTFPVFHPIQYILVAVPSQNSAQNWVASKSRGHSQKRFVAVPGKIHPKTTGDVRAPAAQALQQLRLLLGEPAQGLQLRRLAPAALPQALHLLARGNASSSCWRETPPPPPPPGGGGAKGKPRRYKNTLSGLGVENPPVFGGWFERETKDLGVRGKITQRFERFGLPL